MKDYYAILNVKPDAPATAVKQSYRKLALKYHPDHNAGDTLCAIVFSEIAEAYAVLSNPAARKNYNNQRYYTAINEYVKPAETIDDLLHKTVELKNKISKANPFHFNSDALYYFMKQLFPANISMLLQTDSNKQKQFLENIIWCSKMLHSTQIKNLMQLMMPLFTKHNWMLADFEKLISEQTKKERWEKYKTALAFLIAVILCALIFLATKHK